MLLAIFMYFGADLEASPAGAYPSPPAPARAHTHTRYNHVGGAWGQERAAAQQQALQEKLEVCVRARVCVRVLSARTHARTHTHTLRAPEKLSGILAPRPRPARLALRAGGGGDEPRRRRFQPISGEMKSGRDEFDARLHPPAAPAPAPARAANSPPGPNRRRDSPAGDSCSV